MLVMLRALFAAGTGVRSRAARRAGAGFFLSLETNNAEAEHGSKHEDGFVHGIIFSLVTKWFGLIDGSGFWFDPAHSAPRGPTRELKPHSPQPAEWIEVSKVGKISRHAVWLVPMTEQMGQCGRSLAERARVCYVISRF